MNSSLNTWRCSGCGRILAKLLLVPGTHVEHKCKCNTMNVLIVPVLTNERVYA